MTLVDEIRSSVVVRLEECPPDADVDDNAVGAVTVGRIVDNVFNALNDGRCITSAEPLVIEFQDFDTIDADGLGYTICRNANNACRMGSMATVIAILVTERENILATILSVLGPALVKLYYSGFVRFSRRKLT